MRVTASEGHRIWAPGYDAGLNPLLALESRVLRAKLPSLEGLRVLDVACGTGRSMLLARGVFGIDVSPEMLREAARKPALSGRLALADAARLPFANSAADLTLCSFALGYFDSPAQILAEMARVTKPGARLLVTDLHPDAVAAGWTRSFRSHGELYEMDHRHHPADLWRAPGLSLDWRIDAHFGDPERAIFRDAGKESSFAEVRRIPAVLAMCWIKS